MLAQTRIASDFELQQMQRQVERSRDFLSQVSGRLNLGDVRVARNETALARAEYTKALQAATKERLDARQASNLTRYATATSYAALATAKLGDEARSFELSEEALRYASDSAKTWNLYASAMSLLGKPAKAAGAARNAVAIASRETDRLDLAIDQYALASALIEMGQIAEAEGLLVDVVGALRSNEFASQRSGVARRESFEIYSTARGEESAYISLLNRSQLRLGALYERRGEREAARQQYEHVLAARSDDPTALAALARLARSSEERERYFADAFDANPFSMALIREYRSNVGRASARPPEGASTGAQLRRLLDAMQRGELQSARTQLDALTQRFPDNDTLRALGRDIDERTRDAVIPEFLKMKAAAASPTVPELKSLVALFNDNRFTAEERAALDAVTLTSVVAFDAATPATNQTILESGAIDGVAFRFSEPIAFTGSFAAHAPLRLTYRVLGASGDALLLEPLKLEEAR